MSDPLVELKESQAEQWAGEIAELERFANLPFRGRAISMWSWFMRERVNLADCYRGAVAAVLAAGQWRNKAHPIAWLRRTAEIEAVNAFGVPPVLKPLPRVCAYDEDGKPIADDILIDRQDYGTPEDDIDRWGVPAELRTERGNGDAVDWEKVCRAAGFDSAETRVFIATKVQGISRDKLMGEHRGDRRAIQSAARRLTRKQQRIGDTLRGAVSEHQADAATATKPEPKKSRYVAPATVLGFLAIRREGEAFSRRWSVLLGQIDGFGGTMGV